MRPPAGRTAFTLVELLVVVAIIGVLAALLLPAVAAVRENMHQLQCRNNVSQLAKGCLAHRSTHGHLPTGGWGFRWVGDPDRGYGVRQPSGWMYNVLSYIGYNELHDRGLGQSASQKKALAKQRLGEIIPLFHCPSRRRAEKFVFNDHDFWNADRPETVARNDYAANGGDLEFNWSSECGGPATLEIGDQRSDSDWNRQTTGRTDAPPNGVIYLRSQVSLAPDGDSCTYLCGEKYLRSDRYIAGDADNDQGWDQGYDLDTTRWTKQPPRADGELDQDTYVHSGVYVFGSVHTNGFIMAFCDGHVVIVNFDIAPEVHRQLGNRKDGQATDVSKLE